MFRISLFCSVWSPVNWCFAVILAQDLVSNWQSARLWQVSHIYNAATCTQGPQWAPLLLLLSYSWYSRGHQSLFVGPRLWESQEYSSFTKLYTYPAMSSDSPYSYFLLHTCEDILMYIISLSFSVVRWVSRHDIYSWRRFSFIWAAVPAVSSAAHMNKSSNHRPIKTQQMIDVGQ